MFVEERGLHSNIETDVKCLLQGKGYTSHLPEKRLESSDVEVEETLRD